MQHTINKYISYIHASLFFYLEMLQFYFGNKISIL